MTSLKWWISASMLVASSWRGGSAYLRFVGDVRALGQAVERLVDDPRSSR